MMGTASRDDNRVRDQVSASLYKVPPYGRQRFQSTHRRLVAALWRSCRQVLQELRKGVLSGSDEDRVCVRYRLIRQRCDVEATKEYVGTARTILVSDLVRPICVGDIDLNDHQVWLVGEVELLDMLIVQRDLEVGIEIRGQSCQAKGRKERVFDRPPIRTRCFGQRRKNQLYASNGSSKVQSRLLSGLFGWPASEFSWRESRDNLKENKDLICGESWQAKGRKKRILDRPPIESYPFFGCHPERRNDLPKFSVYCK
jgi:hypothetical protein